jgi:23S rRNA pseudouridine1911/1915/1917 synthase
MAHEPESESTQQTLLEWATRLCPDSPRKRVKEWIAGGRFYLDGQVVTQASQLLADPGDRLTLGKPDSSVASWAHRKRIHPKVTVLHLDASLAIVDKGPGLLSVPGEGGGASALEILGDYLNDPKGDPLRRRLFGGPAKIKPLPVHRLDQYTSGLLCLAFNDEARSVLIEQLRTHRLLREYIAFVDGVPEQKSGTWTHYLKLLDNDYRQSLHEQPVPGATEAVTHYSVERVFARNRVCRVRIRLETGLKHQIRIQAAAAGLPLIGDRFYHEGTQKALKHKGAPLPYGFRRQALHAATIGLWHPEDGREMRFDSPIPNDLARLQNRLA